MKPLRLEFGNLRRRPPWWSLVLFSIGLLASMAGAWRLGQAQVHLVEMRANAALQNERKAGGLTPSPKQPVFELAQGQVKAINVAVDLLNVPWDGLFKRLESVRSPEVAFLLIEPDSATGTVRLVCEARDASGMLAFVKQLAAPNLFGSGVMLVKHELNAQDPDRPYRFEVQARWGASR